jgi:hypothetical protein
MSLFDLGIFGIVNRFSFSLISAQIREKVPKQCQCSMPGAPSFRGLSPPRFALPDSCPVSLVWRSISPRLPRPSTDGGLHTEEIIEGTGLSNQCEPAVLSAPFIADRTLTIPPEDVRHRSHDAAICDFLMRIGVGDFTK